MGMRDRNNTPQKMAQKKLKMENKLRRAMGLELLMEKDLCGGKL